MVFPKLMTAGYSSEPMSYLLVWLLVATQLCFARSTVVTVYSDLACQNSTTKAEDVIPGACNVIGPNFRSLQVTRVQDANCSGKVPVPAQIVDSD